MNISEIQDAITEAIVARGCFLVDTRVSKDNEVEITVESENGTVTLDDCAEISRAFESAFDREKEDYAITVTSAGLDMPFKVRRQYEKAVGRKVEAAFKGGRKIVAVLTAVDDDSITLDYTSKEMVEGSKKKTLVEHSDTFPMTEVNTVRYFIEFEG